MMMGGQLFQKNELNEFPFFLFCILYHVLISSLYLFSIYYCLFIFLVLFTQLFLENIISLCLGSMILEYQRHLFLSVCTSCRIGLYIRNDKIG